MIKMDLTPQFQKGIAQMKSEKHKEFEALVKPLMRWLRENHHPHVTVVVDSRHAECLEGLYNVVFPVED